MVWTDLFQGLIMMTGLGVILGRGTYLAGGVSRVWEINVATGRIEWANWDPSPFSRNTSLGIFCGQVRNSTLYQFSSRFTYVSTMVLKWTWFFNCLLDFEIVCIFSRQFTRNDREQTKERVKWNSVVFWCCKEELLLASSANFSKGILAL